MLFGFIILLVINFCSAKESGIYFRLNQKAVDYIADLSCTAVPSLLEGLLVPKIVAGPVTISDFHIKRVDRPSIDAKFRKDFGARANVTLPFISLSSNAYVSAMGGWLTYEGNFMGELRNTNIQMDLHFTKENGSNIINVTQCEVTHSDVQLLMDAKSELVAIRNELTNGIKDGIREALCTTVVQAIKYLDAQQIQETVPTTTTTSTTTTTTTTTTTSSPGAPAAPALHALELGYSLCKPARMDAPVEETTEATEEVESNSTNYWGADLSLTYPPKFTDEEVVFGLDGGILLNNQAAIDVDSPRALNTSALDKRMVGILLSEYVPNTLFSHIYDNDMGVFHERFLPEHLPKALKKVGRLICSKCYLDVVATLSEKPRVEIDDKLGARVELSGNVSVKFHGRDELHHVINANTKMHITLKPTIRNSRLYGDISLTNVDVNVFDFGLGGSLAGPAKRITSFLVPRTIWPLVKKRLRFALNKRGIKLPVICGVELEHLTLDYIDHAAVLNTDFTFDIHLFLRTFKQYLLAKARIHPHMPTYANAE